MLFDQCDIREAIRLIACQLGVDPALRDDLYQEGLIHLWRREESCPGQSPGWYLQSCRFHLRNYLRYGCSVDSPKRFRLRHAASGEDGDEECLWDDTLPAASMLAEISAREMCVMLSPWLTALERQILACMTDGLGMRKIALRLGISHSLVIRRRRRMASLAFKLGIRPLSQLNRNERSELPGAPSPGVAENPMPAAGTWPSGEPSIAIHQQLNLSP